MLITARKSEDPPNGITFEEVSAPLDRYYILLSDVFYVQVTMGPILVDVLLGSET